MTDSTRREWTFACASAAEAGDFLQVLFTDNADSVGRYVLLSTQFEFPQDHDIQIETNGGEWFAQVRVEAASLSREKLTLDGIANGKPVAIRISFGANDAKFAELQRVIKIMLPMTKFPR